MREVEKMVKISRAEKKGGFLGLCFCFCGCFLLVKFVYFNCYLFILYKNISTAIKGWHGQDLDRRFGMFLVFIFQ